MWTLGFAFTVVLLARGGVSIEEANAARKEGDCKCVPYYLCPSESSSGRGTTEYRNNRRCENYLELCCESPTAAVPSQRPPERKRKTECGRRNPGGVGHQSSYAVGVEARFGEFPWTVAVMKSQEGEVSTEEAKAQQCGGSLIHPRVVLTGAHCVAGKEPHQLTIRAGEWDVNTEDEPFSFQERGVERIIVHENFTDGNLFNDVALLYLSRPVVPAENIGFACVPEQGYSPPPGTRCFATGWGKDVSGDGSQNSGILKRIDVPVVANPECQTALRNTILGRHFKLHQSFMCAGGEHGRDACKGDGGSPLVCPLPDHPGIFIQSGIVAWGIGCGQNQTPGVYASVSFFRNWIDEQMSNAHLDTSYYSYRQQ